MTLATIPPSDLPTQVDIYWKTREIVTFGFNALSVLLVLSKQMPSSTQSSVEKSLLIWSLWQLPSFSAPLSVQLSVWGDF